MESAGPMKPPPLDNTLGALLLGSCVGFMAYGVMLHQAYRYFRMYRGDRPALKGLVVAVILAETFHTILCIISCYEFLVSNYFDPVYLLGIHWYLKAGVPAASVVVLLVQIFYACRIYYIGPKGDTRSSSPSQFFSCLITLLGDWLPPRKRSLSRHLPDYRTRQLNSAAFHDRAVASTTEDYSRTTWTISVGYGNGVVFDLITTSTLVTVLRRSRTGFKRTDSVLDTLVLYTVSTGLLATVTGALIFVFALAYPDSLIYIGLTIPGVKAYSNCMLAMLNSRHNLSERLNQGLEADSLGLEATARFRAPTTCQSDTWNTREIAVPLPTAIDLAHASAESNTTLSGSMPKH
ncbi:hypothetical protein BC628DRAFT_91647 [Trametes gibbosa]|nr:hypothetical protein BC628DRAFT_91647 [Trametes gibbosa]